MLLAAGGGFNNIPMVPMTPIFRMRLNNSPVLIASIPLNIWIPCNLALIHAWGQVTIL